jgi:hypothetical protein
VRNLGALGERDFRLFFAGQSISILGDGMSGVALAFAVLDLTGKAADLGYVFAATSIPLVGFLLVGGVFADRLPRRAVMVGADVARFGAKSTQAALLVSGHAHLWELIVLQVVHGTASAFFNPSLTGLTPTLVQGEHLQQANVLRGIAQGAGGIAGPAIGGGLVASVGSGWALGVDGTTFLASAACLAALRLPPHERLPSQRFLHDLRDGWREFTSRTWLWAGVCAAGVANMCAQPFFVLGALVSKESLGGPKAWALILSSFSVGNLLGGLAALRLRPRRPFFTAFLLYLPFSLPSLLLAAHAGALGIAAAALVAGAGLMVGNALWETTLQQRVPRAALSRVTAYDWFGSLVGTPLGSALIGPLVAGLGVRGTLLAAAGATAAANLSVMALPSVRGVTARDGG